MTIDGLTYPVELRISENTSACIGFKDDRVEIRVKVPIIGEQTITLKPDRVHIVGRAFVAARNWRDHGKRIKGGKGVADGDLDRAKKYEVQDDVEVYIGFADAHVTIRKKILGIKWITLRIDPHEIELVEKVEVEQKKWMTKPDIERFLEGAE